MIRQPLESQGGLAPHSGLVQPSGPAVVMSWNILSSTVGNVESVGLTEVAVLILALPLLISLGRCFIGLVVILLKELFMVNLE